MSIQSQYSVDARMDPGTDQSMSGPPFRLKPTSDMPVTLVSARSRINCRLCGILSFPNSNGKRSAPKLVADLAEDLLLLHELKIHEVNLLGIGAEVESHIRMFCSRGLRYR